MVVTLNCLQRGVVRSRQSRGSGQDSPCPSCVCAPRGGGEETYGGIVLVDVFVLLLRGLERLELACPPRTTHHVSISERIEAERDAFVRFVRRYSLESGSGVGSESRDCEIEEENSPPWIEQRWSVCGWG